MTVGLLTIEQKDQLVGQSYADSSFFNPIQDGNDNWIISTEEINDCVNEEYTWIKELELIEFVEPIDHFSREQ